MAETSKRLCAGVFSNSNATLYTVPSSYKVYVKAITICNITDVDDVFTLKLNGIELMSKEPIAARKSFTIPYLDQIIHSTELIEGSSGNVSSINYYISGREVG